MRVTFVALTYAPSVGGAQAHVQHVAEGLVARGHAVTVLTTDSLRTPGTADPGKVEPNAEEIGGVHVRRFSTRGPLGRINRALRLGLARVGFYRWVGRYTTRIGGQSYVPLSLPMAWAVRRAYRTDDVVVAVSAPFLTLVVPPHLQGRAPAAAVAMPLLHLEGGRPHATVVRALRRFDGVTASTGFERSAQVGLGVDPSSIAVLPPGVDPEQFPDLAPSEARARLGLAERPTVGFIGRLAAYKGVDTLLEAAPALWADRSDLTVLVAGSPAGWLDLDRAIEQARAHGGDRLTVRLGFTSEEKPLLFAACDVIAFPSREESFGLATVEAWAARRPVVAASIGAVRDVIRPGVDGVLVAPGDAAAVAAAVDDLLDHEDQRRRMGEAGRRRAAGDLSWPAILDGWERFLEASVARRRAVLAGSGG